ncbi:MAG: efflux RND transporter permease subunit [Acidobacteria bacterium]|nr:efflux RND transporter permease subunit [Acidobacteriota bacterium]
MRLVFLALRRPVTIVTAVVAIALIAALAALRMPVDIFPDLGAPTIYVAQPFGGMDPSQMEGFITYYYEYHFLYITGIEHVESKSIQGASLMKLSFHPGTDMSQAMSQVVGYVNRARAFMPPGAVGPFIVRYDAGSVPVGQLVFSSPTRSPSEMQNIALNQVRPLFATLPGVSAPPPFGGNQRTVVIRLDSDKMRSYRVSPEDAIAAVNQSTAVMPSGNVRTGDLTRIASTNATVGANVAELLDAPVRGQAGPSVYLRDIATAEVGADIVTGYAHVNGRRTVYIEVTKRSEASTLAVIQRVKEAMPKMQAVCPPDVSISLVFDQSKYVVSAIRGLINEGLLGAVLTGLMVLVFLRDWRSALIVILTIPFALLAAVVWLWAAGQTINIMTLGGLALAVGVLVDEATVEIENIHSHLAGGMARAQSVVDATRKTATPRLLSMLCILSVFVPSFFMAGVGRQLFVPLSMAVGLAMISSYLLSSTLVPVLSVWIMREGHEATLGAGLRELYGRYLDLVVRLRWPLVALYGLGAGLILWAAVPRLGTEIFPQADAGQFQLRLRAPTGTRIERTELIELKALDLIRQEVGPDNVDISTAFIGVQPASYPINTIYLWTSGPHEAVILAALKPSARARGEELRERLRARFHREMPDVQISFEAGDIISQVMSFGSPTPIEVAVQGPNMANNRAFAAKVFNRLSKMSELRDLQYAQPLDYPTVDVAVDRQRAGQFGLTAAGVARSMVAATSSSRFTDPNYWRDPASGNGFQIQVEIPQNRMRTIEDVQNIPVMKNGAPQPLLGDVATVKYGTAFGEVERYNMQRVVSMTANIHGMPLGVVAAELRRALKNAGEPPRGSTLAVRGQIPPLDETLSGLRIGLALSIGVIFILLAANFQSLRLALAVMSTIPAVLCGVALMLLVTGTTLNVQSFMGAIMAVGIAVANAILMVTFAEAERRGGTGAHRAAVEGGRGRLRAIVMTATAMTAGMVPIAAGAEQTAPLGRAVIGGLVVATFATLTVLPAVYAIFQGKAPTHSPSLDPSDPDSRFHAG